MASPFARSLERLDSSTVKRMGKVVSINSVDHIAVESHLLPEMGPLNGDAISLVVFSLGYRPTKNDVVSMDGVSYSVTQHRLFNGKPQIWIE